VKILTTLERLVACDTETTGLNVWQGDAPFAFSFCDEEGCTGYFEFPVNPFTRRVQYEDRPKELRELREFFGNPEIDKVFHNAKFDIRMIETNVGPVRGKIHETMFAAHACNSDEINYRLKDLCQKYADFPIDDQIALKKAVITLRRKAKKLDWKISSVVAPDYWLTQYWDELGVDKAYKKLCKEYAVYDAERTMLLWKFYENLMEEFEVRHVYDQEMRLFPVVYAMETRGVRVSLKEIDRLTKAHRVTEAEALTTINQYGEEALTKGVFKDNVKKFNPNSPIQLGQLLYDYLWLKPPPKSKSIKTRKRKTTKPTDTDTLKKLAEHHELPDIILRYRSSRKGIEQMTAYSLRLIHHADCVKLHADFQQVGPKTGRFACRNPNLMQVATAQTSRGAHPIDSRAPFGPAPHCVWYCIDYSQQEVRICADISQETNMLKIIKRGGEIHTDCANHVWGGFGDSAVAAALQALGLQFGSEDVSDSADQARKKFKGHTKQRTALNWLEHWKGDIVAAEGSLGKKNTRNKAKMVIFNKLYGGGLSAIMTLAGVRESEARKIMRDYDKAFPGLTPWMHEVQRYGRSHGHVLTAFGRKITVDPNYAYRGVNYVVQGSAADLMKRAMLQCTEYFQQHKVKAWIVLTVHDELIFEFDKREPRMRHVRALKRLMENHGGTFSIPIPTDVERVDRKWNVRKKVLWCK